MATEDHARNEISGTVRGPSVQARDVHGDVVMRSSGRSDVDEWQHELAGHLADKVNAHSTQEEEHGRVDDPRPLPVRWRTAAEELSDHWTNIRGTPGHDIDPMSLTGRFTAIRQTYEAVPSRRLMILGRAGAGKTVLAHHLILALLNETPRTGPVPVLFSLSDWNPTSTALRRWMIGQLLRDHPFLDIRDRTGQRGAEALIDNGWILPVLDGFDELPKQRRGEAINELSRLKGPLIVTSRPDEYRAATQSAKALGRAAAIELDDLSLDEAEQYLQASTSKTRSNAWQTVFEHLRANPDDTASRHLTPVLTTPLMVMLARTTYNDATDRHPRELLDTHRFPTREELQQHLLAAYTDTLYDPRRTPAAHRDTDRRRATRPDYDPELAHHWLGHLATHLTRRGTHDLTWWHLPTTLHRHTRVLVTTAAFGLAFTLGFGMSFAIPLGSPFPVTTGLVFGTGFGLMNARASRCREPERLRIALRPRTRARARTSSHVKSSTSEFAAGFAVGAATSLVIEVGASLTTPITGAFTAALTGMLTAGTAFGLVFGLVNLIASALGENAGREAIDQWQLLTTDRTTTVVKACASGLMVCGAIALGVVLDLVLGFFPTAFTFGLTAGLARLALSAWGSWLLFARLWLPLTGRLPWHPKRFLEDAYRRGVLRQAGAVYQFRHAHLRDHLATQYRTKPRKLSPTIPGLANTTQGSATTT